MVQGLFTSHESRVTNSEFFFLIRPQLKTQNPTLKTNLPHTHPAWIHFPFDLAPVIGEAELFPDGLGFEAEMIESSCHQQLLATLL